MTLAPAILRQPAPRSSASGEATQSAAPRPSREPSGERPGLAIVARKSARGPQTLHVPQDAETIAAAINHGATIVNVSNGKFEFALHADSQRSDATTYEIRGLGRDRTHIVVRDPELFGRFPGVRFAFSDLTLESRGPTGRTPLKFSDAQLGLQNVRVLVPVHMTRVTAQIKDSALDAGINAIDGELAIVNSKISNAEPKLAAVRGSASAHGRLDITIRDSLIDASWEGLRVWLNEGSVEATLERVAITGNRLGSSLTCMGSGRYNVALKQVIFYRNESSGVIASTLGRDASEPTCGQLTIDGSMFVDTRGIAIESYGSRITATNNLGWQNQADALGWTPLQPFVQADPRFIDPTHGNFCIGPGSAALSVGPGVELGIDPSWQVPASFFPLFSTKRDPSDSPPRPEAPPEDAMPSAKSAGPVPARGQVAPGRKRALVVGVQQYRDRSIRSLKYARSDAESVAQYLTDAGYQVTQLLDDKASVAAVKAALIELTQANPADAVVLYFSLHGSGESNPLGSGRGFLLLSDAVNSKIPATSLSVQEVQTAIERTASEQVVLIVDSCFSGGASGGAKSMWGAGESKADTNSITGTLYGRGKIGLFSSRDNEVSLEADDFRHGYFTHYLLEAWRRGLRSLDEVYPYVLREVASHTRDQQHPRFSSAQAEGRAPTF